MPITFDAASTSPDIGADPDTGTHVVGSGANRFLVACVVSYMPTVRTILSVTFGARLQPMFLIGSQMRGGNDLQSALYGLANPDVGSGTITVDWDAAPNSCEIAGMSYFGCIGARAATGKTGTAAGFSMDVTGVKFGDVIAIAGDVETNVPTPDAAQTVRWTNPTVASQKGYDRFGDAPTVTLSYSIFPSSNYCFIAAPLIPYDVVSPAQWGIA